MVTTMAQDNNHRRQKTMLHELLKEAQEPFHRQSKSTSLPVKRRAAAAAVSSNLCRHACFFTLHGGADDATKSPFLELRSPVIIRKSPPSHSPSGGGGGGVFLDIPSRIASVLLEAALRIQKPKPRPSSHAGLGLFGSFLKKLKASTSRQVERSIKTAPPSSSCVGWTERHCRGTKSTSGDGSEEDDNTATNSDFDFPEKRFCMSPFVFSVRRSPSSSGVCTPELCSPVGSPGHPVMIKENANNNEEEEEEEQCSPVSVLDPPLDEGGEEKEETVEEDDDDYDLESSYSNVQRAKQQLLRRLGRFERLAELDPDELERGLMVDSSDDDDDEFEPPNLSEPQYDPHSTNKKLMLMSNVVMEEKCEIICCSRRLDSKRELGFSTIDTMVEFDFKREGGGAWAKVGDEVEETAEGLEVSILDSLMEELI